MSQFALLLFEDESAYATADSSVFGQVLNEHNEFGVKHAAALKAGSALQPEATARIVRGASVTDGPFVETKEALGGFYLIEADTLDDAVDVARDVPHRFGYVEVRPVRTFD
jgi:hypothetical protein